MTWLDAQTRLKEAVGIGRRMVVGSGGNHRVDVAAHEGINLTENQ